MEEDKMPIVRPETVIDRKLELFRTLVPVINERIGRAVDPGEKEAIAFAIEESFQGPITAEDFLSGIFGVKEGEVGRDAAMKIHNSVYGAKMRKLDRMIDENPSDTAFLREMKDHIGIGHNQTLENHQNPNARIYIGNVREDWIPYWCRSPNSPLGQES